MRTHRERPTDIDNKGKPVSAVYRLILPQVDKAVSGMVTNDD